MRWLAAALALAGPAAALELSAPLDCPHCYIQSYVDRDPGPGAADYTCGALSYDGHKGTDFRTATIAEMRRGVPIIAAAPGVVVGVRNDQPEGVSIPGQECGNGVVIAHDGGFETQYCHLAPGSITVKAGDTVERGRKLGLMGLSGNTEFPHLHFSVRRDGEPVDPFDGRRMASGCTLADEETLWAERPAYRSGGLVDAGFTDAPPELEAIRAGPLPKLTSAPAALIIWARFYGLSKGDEIQLILAGPNGETHAESVTVLDRSRAEEMRFTGVRSPQPGWPAGRYWGVITLRQNGVLEKTKVISHDLN
ncbi:MAG: M23 family metallopeptidase [Pseudomonadota bacterium]